MRLTKKDEIRLRAEASLEVFIRLVAPRRVLGGVHCELIHWMTRPEAPSHQLVLMPRDHQKSVLAGYRAAWEIVRNPSIRILYISSTANLAVKQLKFIKDILTSRQVQFYWPDLIHPEEGKREKWTAYEIAVNHPKRKEDMVRDPTVWAAGLTTNIVGMHSDITIMDDVVTAENAETEEGRDKARRQYSLLSSIEGAYSRQLIVGTRYHPKDLYDDIRNMRVQIFEEDGELSVDEALYEIFERQVEVNGEFLWPRQITSDGRAFGFNAEILARKKAQYLDQMQFRAQYYNDPNDPEGAGIKSDSFQYYDRSFLSRSNGTWYYKNLRLNIVAAIDFAYSLKANADYTSIVVVGVDSNHQYYVLDVDRFRAGLPSEYFEHILRLHQKWDFRKLRAEVTAAQEVIVNDLKASYIRKHGLSLSIDATRPTRMMGSKEERIYATLQPRYNNLQMWHYVGGHCQTLEEELVMSRPPHDDVKDALAMAVDVAVAPSHQRRQPTLDRASGLIHNRFGGVV